MTDKDKFKQFLSEMGWYTEWYYDKEEDCDIRFLWQNTNDEWKFKLYSWGGYVSCVAILAFERGLHWEYQKFLDTLDAVPIGKL